MKRRHCLAGDLGIAANGTPGPGLARQARLSGSKVGNAKHGYQEKEEGKRMNDG